MITTNYRTHLNKVIGAEKTWSFHHKFGVFRHVVCYSWIAKSFRIRDDKVCEPAKQLYVQKGTKIISHNHLTFVAISFFLRSTPDRVATLSLDV